MADLNAFPLSVSPAGINQSAPNPTETDLEEIENFGIFRGRLGLRAPVTLLTTLTDHLGANVTSILEVTEHASQLWVASHSTATDRVYLHSMDADGTNVSSAITVWTSVTTAPVVSLVSFTSGAADSPQARLYISDYNQNQITRYYDGTNMQDLDVDLDANDTAESVAFSLMIPFKFHLWGSGFFEAAIHRPEMLRFSQPGAIAGTDPAGGTPESKEWFSADHRSVGRRGDKIISMAVAGDRLVVFQTRATHVIYGSGSDTWTRQGLSDTTGCVGPHASASVDQRIVYFWASDGPYRTDGSQLQYIGEPIKQLVTEVDAAEADVRVGYSSDDDIVHFVVSEGGADDYSLILAFDHRNERWIKHEWLVGTATPLEIGAFSAPLSGSTATAGAGPDAAPSSLSATAQSDTQIDLAWTNGDTNIDTKTRVYRGTSTGFTANDGSLIATLASGVDTYEDTDVSADTEYFYEVEHRRNSQDSGVSNEASATTWLADPDKADTRGITGGVELTITNNASGSNADVRIERKPKGGSFSELVTLTDPGATVEHDDTTGNVGTEYVYRSKAQKTGSTDSELSPEASHVAGNADDVPTAPTGLLATSISSSRIDLAWNDNADDEDEYRVLRSTDGSSGPFNPVMGGFLDPNSTSFSDTGLDPATTYWYKVQACNNVGCSDSNVDSAQTSA